MADLRNYQRAPSRMPAPAPTPPIDEGLRAYMLKVYNFMALGLAITGLAALGTLMLATTNDPAAAAATLGNGKMLTSFGVALYGSPLKWVVMLAPLGMVFFLSARINTMSVSAAQTAFWVFAGLMGLSLSSIFLVYTGAEHHADLLHHRRRVRRAVAVGLHDQARPDRHGLVPVHGRDRPDHRDGGQHLPAVAGAAVRHLGDRRADLRGPHRLRHAEDQGDVFRGRRRCWSPAARRSWAR